MKNANQKAYGPSTVATLKVVRLQALGAFLDAGTGNTRDDILLHRQQWTHEVHVGDELQVFLYLDPKRRLTASMRVPRMKEGQIARLTVINTTRDGAFVDVGAERGIFMPFAGMRGRPQVGEKVWGKLYIDKSGRLAVTMAVENEIRQAARFAENVRVGTWLHGSVYNLTEKGAFLFTDERYIVFISRHDMETPPHVGEERDVRITYIREDGRLNGSFREVKEQALFTDSRTLLAYLQTRDGRMPYSDASSPEVLRNKFHLSKAAFKRALGHLLREGLVREKDGWTYLVSNPYEK